MKILKHTRIVRGGAGSGNFDHVGRPGKVGGSASSGGAKDLQTSKQTVFEFLDELEEAGETNMFGASSNIQNEFDVDKREADRILLSWMANKREQN